jgi:hypothetical protein
MPILVRASISTAADLNTGFQSVEKNRKMWNNALIPL